MTARDLQALIARAAEAAMTYSILASSWSAAALTKQALATEAARSADTVGSWIHSNCPMEKVNREAWSRQATHFLMLAEAWSRIART
jgi:anti-sigma factor RsiW